MAGVHIVGLNSSTVKFIVQYFSISDVSQYSVSQVSCGYNHTCNNSSVHDSLRPSHSSVSHTCSDSFLQCCYNLSQQRSAHHRSAHHRSAQPSPYNHRSANAAPTQRQPLRRHVVEEDPPDRCSRIVLSVISDYCGSSLLCRTYCCPFVCTS